MAKGAPDLPEKQMQIIKRKAANRQTLSKFEIRALYAISQEMFCTWMLAIDDVENQIRDWKRKRTFTPAEVNIIIVNFGEIRDWKE